MKVVAGSNTDITASSWASHTGYTISCGDAKSIHAKLSSVTRTANTCNYRITAKAAATAGDATFTIPYSSSSGATLDAQVTVKVSNIAFTAPTNLTMAAGETLAVSAGGYATDGTFTITCADATNISTEFTSVSRTANTCNYSAVAKATASAGACHLHRAIHLHWRRHPQRPSYRSPSLLSFLTPHPQTLKVVAGAQTPTSHASSWASHTGYTISCGDAKSIHAKLSSVTRTANTCNYRITAKAAATAGDATFTIPYSPPHQDATLRRASHRKSLQHRLHRPHQSHYGSRRNTWQCRQAATPLTEPSPSHAQTQPSISTEFTSVSRTANTCNYSAVAKATASAGSATFTVPYTSSGGDTQNGVITITITAISYTAPTDLKVVAGSNTDITASSWASHTGYTISCGDAKSIHAKLSSVTRPDAANKPCELSHHSQSCGNGGRCHLHHPLHLHIRSHTRRASHRKSLQHRLYSPHQSHNGRRRNPSNISRWLCH